MKATFDVTELRLAVGLASKVVANNSPRAVLRNLRIETGASSTIQGTDMEVGISVPLSKVEVDDPFVLLVECKRLAELLGVTTDDQLTVEIDGDTATVTGERCEYKFPTQNPEEYPKLDVAMPKPKHRLTAEALRAVIARSIAHTDQESSRYALGGVLLEATEDELIAVATNGRCLSQVSVEAKGLYKHHTAEDSHHIVPQKALRVIYSVLGAEGSEKAEIALRANDAIVETEAATVYTRLVEGRFPKWRDVVSPSLSDDAEIQTTIPQEMFLRAVRQAAIASNDESRGLDLQLNVKKGELVLSGRLSDAALFSTVALPATLDATNGSTENGSVILDHRYLEAFLKPLSGEDQVHFYYKDGEAPVLMTTEHQKFVLMPMARDDAKSD